MRYILSGIAGSVIAFSLFMVMTHLIKIEKVDIVEPPEGPVIVFQNAKVPEKKVKQEIEPATITDYPMPPTLDSYDPIAPIELDTIKDFSNRDDIGTGQIDIVGPTLVVDHLPSPDLEPEMRIAPKYPIRLLNRGVEGYVMIENTVNQEGRVVHVEILESSHVGFESAVKSSVVRWTYAKSNEAQRKHREKVAFKLTD